VISFGQLHRRQEWLHPCPLGGLQGAVRESRRFSARWKLADSHGKTLSMVMTWEFTFGMLDHSYYFIVSHGL